VRLRTFASGVAVAILAGVAVPVALSTSASAAKAPSSGTATITKCSPATATIGKNVTIHGTDLTGATKVMIGSHNVTADIISNTAKAIKVPVPAGLATASAVTVKAVTPAGTATQTCNFKKAPKKKHHKK
jgi:hypothetical protein